MKKQILILGLVFFSSLAYSQINIDSLVQIGINYHDNGQFDKAIETYKSALKFQPDSPLVNMNIADLYRMQMIT